MGVNPPSDLIKKDLAKLCKKVEGDKGYLLLQSQSRAQALTVRIN
jgi:hypothetical protein